MGLFKKRLGKASRQSVFLLSDRIALAVKRRQRKWADYLNDRVKNVSAEVRLIALVVFCLVWSVYLIRLLIMSIY
ncbi:MAG: hypothetical protein P0Y49_04705 [Candidatus Pedobacter colombiensis]|uniref:Uncharacterized protein n=1 Tax=Candidatus Pedobacter colombiensis TaxID=3121371 RepID=A0AAJ5W9D3_9SPHI|nr:hypothetical protein [Pedobacter sp.]WEK20437.1 MAG: hypothetical protein P0Y49_04705 [Pedobacter sp.]